MAASYSISSVGSDQVKIRIVPDSSYSYYRVFIRLSSDTSDSTIDQVFTITTTSNITLNGLEPETNYTINVGYSNTNTTDRVVGWIGAKTFTTEAEETYYYVKITYNANGGSGAPSGSYTYSDTDVNVPVSISSTKPTRSGYTFLGWATSSTASDYRYSSGNTYNFTGTTSTRSYTLYAVWGKTYKVKITYNANGGSGAPSSQTVSETGTSEMVTVTIPVGEPTKNGATFLGWSTSSTATEPEYLSGVSYVFPGSTSTTSYTLYAVWYQDEYGVRITYVPIDATGSTGAKTYYDTDENVPVTMPTVSKDGHKFLGWSTNLSATTADYLPGQTYNFVGAINGLEQYVLYAVFAALHYVKITYDANGGTGEPDAEQFSDTDDAITVTISSTMPTRDGYTFLGWSFDRTATSADWLAGGVYYNWKGSTDVTTVTLYAVWLRTTRYGGVWINDQYYVPWIYSNGWQKYASYVYSNGWKTTRD